MSQQYQHMNIQSFDLEERKKQLLISIPEANIQIYSHYILLDAGQPQTAESSELKTQNDRTLNSTSWPSSPTKRRTILMFNNPDYAFNIQFETRKVELHNVVKGITEFSFQVKNLQVLLAVQSLLRRKLCQLGFEKMYVIKKQLGKGASAKVFLVERVTDKKLFAAKIISLSSQNQKSYEMFINEAKLLRIVKHKNIINLESLYIHKKELIQVLEYVSGGTLLQLLKESTGMQRVEKWKIMRDLIMGLEHLRAKRIVHRDLKLQNILIRQNRDRTKDFIISDFGLAAWNSENPIYDRCGTPGYIAPEILNSEQGKVVLNHKNDIFSVGVIAHLIFVHRPLYAFNGNIKQLLRVNKKAAHKFVGKQYDSLPQRQYEFLVKTLNKKPEKRMSSRELLDNFLYDVEKNMKSFRDQSEKKERKNQKQKSEEKKKILINSSTKIKTRNISLQIPQNSITSEARASSAKKFISGLWEKFTSPSSKKETLKIKQNSIEKQKKLKEFFD